MVAEQESIDKRIGPTHSRRRVRSQRLRRLHRKARARNVSTYSLQRVIDGFYKGNWPRYVSKLLLGRLNIGIAPEEARALVENGNIYRFIESVAEGKLENIMGEVRAKVVAIETIYVRRDRQRNPRNRMDYR